MSNERGVIVVLAAVVERDSRFLVTRRVGKTHLSGYWEFPGGKCEPDETPAACLERELLEELGVAARIGDELLTTEHDYPDRTVRLHFRRVEIDGAPRPLLGQEIRWASREELGRLQFPEADRELLKLLKTSGVVLRKT
jgi:mutator protein MutT